MRCCATAVRELFCTSGCRGTLLPWGEGGPSCRRRASGTMGRMRGPSSVEKEVAPHQFGRMTYGRAIERLFVVHQTHATVSHGLTSSPPEGERGLTSATLGCLNECLGPLVGPGVERQERRQQLPALRRERVAVGGVVHETGLAQLLEARVEHAGVGCGRLLQGAEGEGLLAQLPQDAQGHAPAQQVEQRHDGASGGRAAHAPAGFGEGHVAIISVAATRGSCYGNSSTGGWPMSASPRIAPANPPYPPE